MAYQQFDDGSSLTTDDSSGAVIGNIDSSGMATFATDAQEQLRMGAGYPANGNSWDVNAAMLGVSRLIDTAGRAYANVKGAQAATYAGQNGQTYSQGRPVGSPTLAGMGPMLPLLALAAIAFLVLKK